LIARQLLAQGIDVSKPVKDVAAVAAAYYGYKGDCPVSERLSNTVLVIPCYHSLNKSDVEHIVGSLNKAWKDLGGEVHRGSFVGHDGSRQQRELHVKN
jgi:dTDP-4-amino-4,6-dideoxygalactose transaminase